MSWIKKIEYSEAEGKLRKLYDRIKGPDGYIDNILKIHGQRPHTLEGHMGLYKNALHHKANTLPKWLLESLGVYVSHLNQCLYCVKHHAQGLRRLLSDDIRFEEIMNALEKDEIASAFDQKDGLLFNYAKLLTQNPSEVTKSLVDELKGQFDEGEILEVNQVVSYFAYANRTVLGLGVNTDGDILGLSPNDNDNPDNWGHQ